MSKTQKIHKVVKQWLEHAEEDLRLAKHAFRLTLYDEEHSGDEDRWITIGQSLNDKILVVIHTYRKVKSKGIVRIISARKAAKHEEKQYFERRS